jgi:hypothetical protein
MGQLSLKLLEYQSLWTERVVWAVGVVMFSRRAGAERDTKSHPRVDYKSAGL